MLRTCESERIMPSFMFSHFPLASPPEITWREHARKWEKLVWVGLMDQLMQLKIVQIL